MNIAGSPIKRCSCRVHLAAHYVAMGNPGVNTMRMNFALIAALVSAQTAARAAKAH
jgi:hypothetical protein